VRVYCIRHGETEWSLNGRHTGRTDLPLTENGRRLATEMRPLVKGHEFELVLTSPLRRARETCELFGLGEQAQVEPDLGEWDYGHYEGLTTAQIHEQAPGWLLFEDGCPGGESPANLAERLDRVIARVRQASGDVALFAHGHVLRTFAARWIELPPEQGQRFLLDTGTVCVLGFYRGTPAIRIWNCPRT